MTAKVLMVQGTMSSAGKSLLVAGLCRLFTRQGLHTAPFKAQNMSNNAAVCADGSEIGRAQYTQALACGIEPTAEMNPVLLKPEADARSQVVVMGKPRATLPAREYYKHKAELWDAVTGALDNLRNQYELVIAEGAGSPAELNLKRGDIVNMAIARYANAPVLLVGDVDRGGIFAQLLGTLFLLEPEERALVKGLIVNKFRGDPTLFVDGIRILEELGRVPVLGVVPYMHNLAIPEEDAVALESPEPGQKQIPASMANRFVDIAVIHLPRISNFDDFDPLATEPSVGLRYVSSAQELGEPQAIILPGTKSTIADLTWLHAQGLAEAIKRIAGQGAAVVGICGGYQMLGEIIRDPQQVESSTGAMTGLGLLPVETIFEKEKATHRIRAQITAGPDWLVRLTGQTVEGYEIHMGHSESKSNWLTIHERNRQPVLVSDGAVSANGRIWGCYIHGLFANTPLRRAWLTSLGWSEDDVPSGYGQDIGIEFDRLADVLENALDMGLLQSILDA